MGDETGVRWRSCWWLQSWHFESTDSFRTNDFMGSEIMKVVLHHVKVFSQLMSITTIDIVTKNIKRGMEVVVC